jgi:multidrug resistance protein MdtO
MERRIQESVPFAELIRQELLPFHGRLAGSLRTTLAVCIAIIFMVVFRTPAIAPGAYLIFLISYETPYLTFTSGMYSLMFQCLGVATTLLLMLASGNAPMARVLGTALFSFIAAFLMKTMRRRGAMDFGVFSLISLALWDLKLPTQTLVAQSMWPVATGAIGVFSAVAVEYAFARRDPFYALHREFEVRAKAIASFLRSLADEAAQASQRNAAKNLVRLSFAGQGKMQALLKEISNRREGAGAYVDEYPLMLPHLFRLLDLAAQLSLVRHDNLSPADREAALTLADFCDEVGEHPFQEKRAVPQISPEASSQFAAMQQAAAALAQMEVHESVGWQPKARGAKPSPPWFVADAWRNPAYLNFALRISLCATLGYILYMALDWPGISTVVLTVLIVGLNNTGAICQKMVLRVIAASIGCLVFGIGSIVFLFPHMDTIASFILLIAAIVFVCSWIARSPHIGYVGMQITFSYFLIAFERFSAPVSMTPARDRVIGIALALVMVWIVFLEIAPVRTVSEMRAALGHVLSAEAGLLALLNKTDGESTRQRIKLHEVIAQQLAAVQSMAEMIPYEIGTERQKHLQRGGLLLEASYSAGDFFLYLAAEERRTAREGTHSAAVALGDELQTWAQAFAHTPAPSPALSDLAAQNLPEVDESLQRLRRNLWSYCASFRVQQDA